MEYVIVGGSAAGISAAKTIRENDPDGKIIVVSKDKFFYSRCQLHYVASGAFVPEKTRLTTSDWANKSEIKLMGGKEVSALDPELRRIIFSNGESLDYDKLLISTGSRTFFPPIEGIDGPMTFGLRDMEDAIAIREAISDAKNVTIVGAGLIGIELAAELLKKGIMVGVVEIADRPLPLQLENVCGAKCAKLLSDAGSTLHFGDSVKRIHRNIHGKPISVELSSGASIKTDLLVCAAGVRTNSEFAAQAGIKVGKGIIIDKFCRTSIDDIYSAGDVSEFEDTISGMVQMTAIWPTAVRQGKVAGTNMSGGNAEININTGMKASISVLGTHAISLGPVSVPQKQWFKHVFRGTDSSGKESVKILYTEKSLLKAALLWGDVANAGLYHEAIVNRRDISTDIGCLESLDAAKRGKEKLSVL